MEWVAPLAPPVARRREQGIRGVQQIESYCSSASSISMNRARHRNQGSRQTTVSPRALPARDLLPLHLVLRAQRLDAEQRTVRKRPGKRDEGGWAMLLAGDIGGTKTDLAI